MLFVIKSWAVQGVPSLLFKRGENTSEREQASWDFSSAGSNRPFSFHSLLSQLDQTNQLRLSSIRPSSNHKSLLSFVFFCKPASPEPLPSRLSIPAKRCLTGKTRNSAGYYNTCTSQLVMTQSKFGAILYEALSHGIWLGSYHVMRPERGRGALSQFPFGYIYR